MCGLKPRWSSTATAALILCWTSGRKLKNSDLPGSVTEESLTEKVGPFWADQFKTRRPRKNYDSDEAWLKAICEFIAAIQEQRFTPKSDDLPPLDEELSTEEFANREQDFEERIDAKIDRDIKQLGQIKTMKAIGIGRRPPAIDVGPLKQIEAPSSELQNEIKTTWSCIFSETRWYEADMR